MTPVYAMGLPGTRLKTPVWECPVSAVPAWIWDLLDLWWTCRAMRALPLAGAVLDQPYVVRRAWPIWEADMRGLETARLTEPTRARGD